LLQRQLATNHGNIARTGAAATGNCARPGLHQAQSFTCVSPFSQHAPSCRLRANCPGSATLRPVPKSAKTCARPGSSTSSVKVGLPGAEISKLPALSSARPGVQPPPLAMYLSPGRFPHLRLIAHSHADQRAPDGGTAGQQAEFAVGLAVADELRSHDIADAHSLKHQRRAIHASPTRRDHLSLKDAHAASLLAQSPVLSAPASASLIARPTSRSV